ncbi:cell division protein FtsH, partial [bacterium]|nr:cell division protein FtsH [bacterium]
LMAPTDDRFLTTKKEMKERISGLLAGRVSEEIFFEDVTNGASEDIEKATKIARMMVTNLGMSSLGPIQYEQPQGNVFLGRDYTNVTRNISSEVAFQIDQEISKIINECMEKAREVILNNKDDLILIAETLLEVEVLTYEQVVYLLEHRVLPEKKEPPLPEKEIVPEAA